YFFFFQAEDGIRDFHVTGVQTCALPISPLHESPISEIHVAHGGVIILFFLGDIGDENFSSKYHTSNAGRILQGGASNFCRIDDRSEERRVGKECRSQWETEHEEENKESM